MINSISNLFELFQTLHQQVTDKEAAFDNLSEQVQALLQISTDTQVSAQLTRLNSKYSALCSSSKVHLELSTSELIQGLGFMYAWEIPTI